MSVLELERIALQKWGALDRGFCVIDRTTSIDRVVAAAAWIIVCLLYAIAGVLMLVGHWKPAVFVAEVACGVATYAAARTLRCYAVRICELIRNSSRDSDGAVPLQRIH